MIPLPTTTQFSGDAEEQVKQIKELHEKVRRRIIQQNDGYKLRADRRRKRVVFEEGDLVWIHLRKERFPGGRWRKLQPRADGPFRIVKRINDNAYKLDLRGKYNVSATFNVAYLSPYQGDGADTASEGDEAADGAEADSRSSLLQEGVYEVSNC